MFGAIGALILSDGVFVVHRLLLCPCFWGVSQVQDPSSFGGLLDFSPRSPTIY